MKIKEYLIEFRKENKAIPAFNIPGYDAMVGLMKASNETSYPIIIQISKNLLINHSPSLIKNLFDLTKKYYNGDCFLHLDHCNDLELINSCISSGWDMVMYDGSNQTLEINCKNSKIISDFAHSNNVAVEGEIGNVPDTKTIYQQEKISESDIEYYVKHSNIDCLAIGFGNIHGEYGKEKNLNWKIFEKAYILAKVPLVLHGTSGLLKKEIKRAINAGASKVNISTDLKKEYFRLLNDKTYKNKVLNSPKLLHDDIIELSLNLAKKYIKILR